MKCVNCGADTDGLQFTDLEILDVNYSSLCRNCYKAIEDEYNDRINVYALNFSEWCVMNIFDFGFKRIGNREWVQEAGEPIKIFDMLHIDQIKKLVNEYLEKMEDTMSEHIVAEIAEKASNFYYCR